MCVCVCVCVCVIRHAHNTVDISPCCSLKAMRGEGRRVNYAYFKAFNQLLNNVDLLEEVMTAATESADTPVTMEQVQMAAQRYPQVSLHPLLFGIRTIT